MIVHRLTDWSLEFYIVLKLIFNMSGTKCFFFNLSFTEKLLGTLESSAEFGSFVPFLAKAEVEHRVGGVTSDLLDQSQELGQALLQGSIVQSRVRLQQD